MINNKDVKLGIYCRLSVDDGNVSDSISIQNQKELLTRYAKEKGFQIIDYYIDDGYSGTNFDRPAFKEMLFDIENKRINTVITKDLSRLGRDYLKVGYYIDTYFPDRDIRYIALSDNIDTAINEDEFIPFKNIINGMYSKDVSKKIRFTIENQMKSGKDVKSCFPLYGYMYDKDSKRIPDPETSKVVKMIFDLFNEGNNYTQIASILKQKQIITPLYYNYQKYGFGANGKGKVFTTDFYDWNKSTIRKILMNDEYLGILRRGKTRQRFKSKKITLVDKDSQYVFYDKYEPLIDKDTFDTAQSQIGIIKKKYTNEKVNRYSGLAFCGVCGKPLRHKSDVRVSRKDFVRLTCRQSSCGPTRGTILYEDLDKILKNEIMSLKNAVLDHKEAFLELANKKTITNETGEYKILENEKKTFNDNISKIELYIRKAYEQKVDGLLPDSVYQPMIAKYSQERNDLIEKIKSLDSRIEDYKTTSSDFSSDAIDFIKKLERINSINCLEEVNLNLLINKIYITTDGKRKRREKMNKNVTIIYKKIDPVIKEFLNEK